MDNSQEPTPIIRRPLHEEATDRLRDLIVQGRLAAGARLNERLLTAQLGLSRTPLREAFKVLATEGLVELLPNRGAIVSQMDAVRLSETLAVMGALDALAGELACASATDAQINEIRALHYEMLAYHARGDLAGYFKFNQAIHLKIVKYSGNAVLYNTYRQLNGAMQRARYMANLSQGALGRRGARARGNPRRAWREGRQAHPGAALGPSCAQAVERARRPACAAVARPGGVNAPSFPVRVTAARPGDSPLARRLRKEVDGEVLFDAASRGRYSTDASIYQVEPIGVVVPRSAEARARRDRDCRRVGRAGAAARRRQLAMRPDGGRGAGASTTRNI